MKNKITEVKLTVPSENEVQWRQNQKQCKTVVQYFYVRMAPLSLSPNFYLMHKSCFTAIMETKGENSISHHSNMHNYKHT